MTTMSTFIAGLGAALLSKIAQMGQALLMLLQAIMVQPKTSSFPRLMQQLYVVGVQSLIIMLVSALFIGMVLGLQGYTLLSAYGSEQAVGRMVALTLVRELAPVVAALLFAGRAGSALTAEIG